MEGLLEQWPRLNQNQLEADKDASRLNSHNRSALTTEDFDEVRHDCRYSKDL